MKISLASTSCRWETGGFWQTQVGNSQGDVESGIQAEKKFLATKKKTSLCNFLLHAQF